MPVIVMTTFGIGAAVVVIDFDGEGELYGSSARGSQF